MIRRSFRFQSLLLPHCVSMPRALLIPLCLTALLAVTLAEPPIDHGGGGGGYSSGDGGYGGGGGGVTIAKAAGHGARYAGPIVYSNEKPPIIHFPPPPMGGNGMGWGNKGPTSIKYIPMPHHDLPILIYQSDSNPPIHVVSPPKGAFSSSPPQGSYGPPKSDYGPPPQAEYGPPKQEYGPPKASFGPPKTEYGPPQAEFSPSSDTYGPPKDSYGPPKAEYGPPKVEYGPPKSSSFGSGSGYGVPSQSNSYGPPKSEYGPPPSKPIYGPPKIEYGGPINVASSSEWKAGPPPPPQGGYGWGPPKPSYGPPKSSYGPPKQKAAPLPHIIYSGHPPIHIFHQEPLVMDSFKAAYGPPPSMAYGPPPSMAYGPPPSSSYGPPKGNSFGPLSSFYGGSSSGSSHNSMISSYGPPKPVYGPPKGRSYPLISSYGPPSGNSFGSSSISPPKGGSFGGSTSSSYGPPSAGSFGSSISNSYGPPSSSSVGGSASSSYGPPKSISFGNSAPSSAYGPPRGDLFGGSSSNSYGPPSGGSLSSISSSYGAPKGEPFGSASSSYGPPRGSSFGGSFSQSYGPPKGNFLTSMLSSFGPSSSSSYGPPRFQYGPPKSSLGYGQGSKSKAKYVIAPKAWHKPPIIIYHGVKPPVHVYQKPEGGYGPSVPVASSSSNVYPQVNPDAVDITYGNSRISQSPGILVDTNTQQKPTILQPQHQPAMRTIYVSGLSSSGSGQYKTYVVTNNNPLTIQPLGYTSGPSMSMTRSNEITVVTPPKVYSSQVFPSQTSSATSSMIEQAQLVHHQPIAQSRSLPDVPDFVNDPDLQPTTARTDNGGDSVEVAASDPLVVVVPSKQSEVPHVDIELSPGADSYTSSKLETAESSISESA